MSDIRQNDSLFRARNRDTNESSKDTLGQRGGVAEAEDDYDLKDQGIVLLERLRSDPKTYTETLDHFDDENKMKDFMTYFYKSIIFQKDEEMKNICLEHPETVGKFHEQFVLKENRMSHEDFWQRYYYRVGMVNEELLLLNSDDDRSTVNTPNNKDRTRSSPPNRPSRTTTTTTTTTMTPHATESTMELLDLAHAHTQKHQQENQQRGIMSNDESDPLMDISTTSGTADLATMKKGWLQQQQQQQQEDDDDEEEKAGLDDSDIDYFGTTKPKPNVLVEDGVERETCITNHEPSKEKRPRRSTMALLERAHERTNKHFTWEQNNDEEEDDEGNDNDSDNDETTNHDFSKRSSGDTRSQQDEREEENEQDEVEKGKRSVILTKAMAEKQPKNDQTQTNGQKDLPVSNRLTEKDQDADRTSITTTVAEHDHTFNEKEETEMKSDKGTIAIEVPELVDSEVKDSTNEAQVADEEADEHDDEKGQPDRVDDSAKDVLDMPKEIIVNNEKETNEASVIDRTRNDMTYMPNPFEEALEWTGALWSALVLDITDPVSKPTVAKDDVAISVEDTLTTYGGPAREMSLGGGNLATCFESFNTGSICSQPVTSFHLELPTRLSQNISARIRQVAAILHNNQQIKTVSVVVPTSMEENLYYNTDVMLLFQAIGALPKLEELNIEAASSEERSCLATTVVTNALKEVSRKYQDENENLFSPKRSLALKIHNMVLMEDEGDFQKAVSTLHTIPNVRVEMDVEVRQKQ